MCFNLFIASNNWTFPDGSQPSSQPTYWSLLVCFSGVYCCQPDYELTLDCCNDTGRLYTASVGMPTTVAARAVTSLSPTTVVQSGTTYTSQVTATSTGTAGAAAGVSSEDCSSEETKVVGVGAGLGAGLGTLLALSVAALVVMSRRNSHLKRELNEYRYLPKPRGEMGSPNDTMPPNSSGYMQPVSQPSGGQRGSKAFFWKAKDRQELPGQQIVELDGGNN